MSKFEKSMEEIFEVEPKSVTEIVTIEASTETIVEEPSRITTLEQDLKDAYEQSKTNLQDIIDQSKEAMEDILEVARESEHPRAYEVYATLLKNVVDANKELLTIQKQMREMTGRREHTGTSIENAVFVGSTAELGKLLKRNQ
jgi:hypothetical protein